nr:uncharacterized protein LOC109165405 [Ipomoea batatas]
MKDMKSWKSLMKKRGDSFEGGTCGLRMKQLPFMGIVCTVMLFIVYRTTNYQHQQTQMESKFDPFYNSKDSSVAGTGLRSLPHGIIQAISDLELKPLWSTSSSKSKVANIPGSHNLLAMPVGIKQKDNVNAIAQKFLPENFTIILFHYDGNLDGWWDLEWSKEAIHIVAHNQTKWWFAKRFLHPAVVSAYDYIFLWDEDLGVANFHPGRYLEIVKSEGLEISQPALDRNSTGIHHRITIRSKTQKFHRFVEGMAPVFSRSAWHCAWHLIQNDLVHGWGLDIKLGYCAQVSNPRDLKKHVVDVRSEIRRQSTQELLKFKERWERAVSEDKDWVDPYKDSDRMSRKRRSKRRRNNRRNLKA